MTGLPTSLRGSSLIRASSPARARILPCEPSAVTAEAMGSAFLFWLKSMGVGEREHLEMLDDGAQGLGGKILQAAEDQDDPDDQADEQRAVGRQRAGGGSQLGLG